MPTSIQERLRRALKPEQGASRPLKAALLFAAFIVVCVVAATAGRRPDLSHVKVAFLSGSEDGNYHAIVTKAAAEAQRRHGRIENLPSAVITVLVRVFPDLIE